MIEPRLFLCSGVAVPEASTADEGRRVVELDALGDDPNVTINISNVARVFFGNLTHRMVDLIELASYVFTGDAGTRRGTQWQNDSEEPWGRDFRFIVPVRDVQFWQREDVNASLLRTLTFLSNDKYSFEFVPLQKDRSVQGYLELGDDNRTFEGIERVIMFSGGLDSLAGAVETAATTGGPLVLVSHRPVAQISARQKALFAGLQTTFPNVPMLHVPVWINKANALGHEPTQRTRSFLFTAIGLCTASMVGAKGVRFYENGVVSLNLPVADEVVRARASRTTHPHSLRLLADFASLVMDRPYSVDNPYLNRTKAEIVSTIASYGGGALIGCSVSCAHTMFKSKSQQHCGSCSQCIDRRVAVFAAGCEALDPSTDYVTDVFTGNRKDTERTMAIHYVRHASELRTMSATAFATQFNLDLTRAVRGEPNASDAVARLYDLHQRHAVGVESVITTQLSNHAGSLVDGRLPPSSLLGLVAGREHKADLWIQYANRISELLRVGIPPMCRTHVPKNEPHLQELCEGLLHGHDPELDREFPFMRWSGSTTKGDYSKAPLDLWIELKYIRKASDIRSITEDIAADITKYGDNGLRVLFVVYDPKHLIKNDDQFAKPISARQGMMVTFIR